MNNHSRILKLSCKVTKCNTRFLATSNIIFHKEVSTRVAKYLPIVDVPSNPREKELQRKLEWFSKIRKLPTIEQKLMELNMPRYYGWKSVVLNDRSLGTTCLDFLKFITRTEVYKNLPTHYYSDISSSLIENAVKRIEDPVREFIHLHHYCGIERGYTINKAPKWIQNNVTQSNFLFGLHNIFLKHLGNDISHLPVDSIDFDPRIEAFWFVGGFEPINHIKKMKEGSPHMKPYADDPVDRRFRSTSKPALALRSNLGLGDVVPFDGSFEEPTSNVQDEVPDVSEPMKNEMHDYSAENFDPLKGSVYGAHPNTFDLKIMKLRRALLIPGFWPGVENEHGLIFFHPRAVMEDRLAALPEEYRDEYRPSYLQQHAINDGFARALSYSFYQGFTPGDELTYPFVQQGVSSDGKNFQFSLYQLNTAYLHSHNSTDNPKINYLWLSEDMPLYETVEGENVKGLNKDVLKILCTMYLKKGIERQNPSPYLANYKYLMHHDAPDEYKEEFQNILRSKILCERRVRRVEQDPLPWEFIYKIKFKTRPMDPKFKYFENTTVSNPRRRRLDDYKPHYIPKIRRIDVRIKKKPIIDSESLFKHKWTTIQNRGKTFEDDPIVFGSMNVDKETPPYYRGGPLWRRGVNKFQKSLLAEKK